MGGGTPGSGQIDAQGTDAHAGKVLTVADWIAVEARGKSSARSMGLVARG